MFVIPFQLFTSRGIFVIFIVSSTRPQIHCPIKRLMSVIRMVFQLFGNVQSVHPVYLLFSLSCFHSVRLPNDSRVLDLVHVSDLFRTSHSACLKNKSLLQPRMSALSSLPSTRLGVLSLIMSLVTCIPDSSVSAHSTIIFHMFAALLSRQPEPTLSCLTLTSTTHAQRYSNPKT